MFQRRCWGHGAHRIVEGKPTTAGSAVSSLQGKPWCCGDVGVEMRGDDCRWMAMTLMVGVAGKVGLGLGVWGERRGGSYMVAKAMQEAAVAVG